MSTKQDEKPRQPAPLQIAGKKQYTRPVLERYGDIRDLTLGTSRGVIESGAGLTRRL